MKRGDLHCELNEAVSHNSLEHDIWTFEQETFGPWYDRGHDSPVGYYRIKNRVIARIYNIEERVPKWLSRKMLLRALKIARQGNRRQ